MAARFNTDLEDIDLDIVSNSEQHLCQALLNTNRDHPAVYTALESQANEPSPPQGDWVGEVNDGIINDELSADSAHGNSEDEVKSHAPHRRMLENNQARLCLLSLTIMILSVIGFVVVLNTQMVGKDGKYEHNHDNYTWVRNFNFMS